MENDPKRTCIISCDVVRKELERVYEDLNCTLPVFWTGSGLHNYPARLLDRLQEMFLHEALAFDRVLLATGFCGNAFCGLKTGHLELVIPRTDDCISFLLGSTENRKALTAHCGTYFLTDGWLESDKSIFAEYRHTVARYGESRARQVFHMMFAHYARIAVIDTGAYDLPPILQKAEELAGALGLRCEVLPGNLDYLRALLTGPWPETRFLTLSPGMTVESGMLSAL